MKRIISSFIIICMLSFTATTAYGEELKYSKEAYLADLQVFEELLEKNHGNLYENVKKEKLDQLFLKAKSKINDKTTIRDFYNELSYIVNAINDGHTSIMSSDRFSMNTNEDKSYLPLKVKFINKKMYCDFINDYIPVGAEILEINGDKVDDIVSKLIYSTGSETGTNGLNFKILEAMLDSLYPQMIKYTDKHTIKYKDMKDNKIKTVVIKSEDVDTQKIYTFAHSNYIKDSYGNPLEPLKAEFHPEKNAAVLRIFTFAPSDYDGFKLYVDKFFEDVNYLKIKNVIFDVRGNLGGDLELLNYILAYVKSQPFNAIKSETIKDYDLVRNDLLTPESQQSLESFTQLKESLSELEGMTEEQLTEEGVKLIKEDLYSYNLEQIEPMKENNFKGNVYALVDGGSFSCGSIFPQRIQELKNGYLVGEEASGNYYSTTAGILPTYYLPNTKLQLTIPLQQLIMHEEPVKNIPLVSGVKPDYPVELTYDDYMKKIDTQLEYVYKLIKQQ